MFKCPNCSKEYERKIQLHGHMLKAHQEEYKKYNSRVDNLPGNKIERPKKEIPEGLRLLDKSDTMEMQAYEEGYRYILNDEVFTADEVKGKGWM